MKKLTLFLVGLLVCIFYILSALDRYGEYDAEKALWYINQDFLKLSRDPEYVPDASYDKLAQKYELFIEEHKESKLNSLANILMGRVYMMKGDYDMARTIFEEMAQKYKEQPFTAVKALSEIDNSYAEQQDYAGMIDINMKILQAYPFTPYGIRAPLNIIAITRMMKDSTKEGERLLWAENYYKRLIETNVGTSFGIDAIDHLALFYIDQQRWEEALNLYGKILIEYATTDYLTPALKTELVKSINTIALVKLKSFSKAYSVYRRFVRKYPEHRFSPEFQYMMKSLINLEEQGVLLENDAQ